MNFRLPLLATLAILGLASQSPAAMITASVSGPVSLLSGTAALNIGTANLTGLPPFDGSYPVNATMTLSGYNAFTDQGVVEISGTGFSTFFGTFSNLVIGPPTAPLSLSRITTDIVLNYPTGLPVGLANAGTLTLNYYLDIIPPDVGGIGAGQLVLNRSVPEPASLAMASIGLASAMGFFGFRRRKAVRV